VPAPHPFTLRQLQYLIAVADTRSFRAAAQACAVSQPALSAQIAAMEGAMGVRLFERDRRRVVPTSAAEPILQRARQLLIDADDLAGIARNLGDPLAGTVRIGVIPTVSPYLLPRIVPVLHARHARLTILWVEEKTDVLVERVQAGVVDAALLAMEVRLPDLERAVLGRDAFVLAAPPGHPMLRRHRHQVRQSDLDGVDVLLLEDGHCLRDQALSVCAKGGANELGFRATSIATLVQMVASGAGVTLLPEMALPTESKRAGLSIRSFANPTPHRTIGMVWRRGTATEVALKAVAATIRGVWDTVQAKPRA
jgi:LysR family transcriptional regulator, hydrogen peroxide-inducible genes activator